MRKYVIDASVVLTWLLTEDKEAESIIYQFIVENNGRLYSHDFSRIEISNGLIVKLSESDKIERYYDLYKTIAIKHLELVDSTVSFARIIARKVEDTVYDASYHALALTHNMIFVTRDRRYYNKAKHLGSIELLE